MKPNVTILNNILTIDGYSGEIDLAQFQMPDQIRARIYDNGGALDMVGTWLLCEVILPAISYDSVGEGEETQSVKKDMDDSDVTVILWDLKEI